MEATASLNRFSDKLSPVFVRELRQGLRARYFVLAFVTFQLVALIATLLEVFVFHLLEASSSSFLLTNLFQFVFALGFSLILPLSQFSALHSEIGKGKNIELLLASGLTRWQIVWGKFLVGTVLSGLLLISLLPYLFLRYFLGSVEPTEILSLVATSFLSNMAMNAIVIGASGYMNAVGRVIAILYFYIIYNLTVVANIQTFGSRSGIASPILSFFCVALGGVVIATLAMQLGRAKLKLFEDPLDPPSSAGVFAITFLVPIANGIAAALGGSPASFVVLALLLWLTLMIDRGPGRNFQSRGLQP